MPILTVDDLKAHLNITGNADDALIAQKIAAAEAWISRWLEITLAEMEEVPADLKEAVRLLVAHLYEIGRAHV